MRRTGTARVLAVLFIGVVLGIYLHFRQTQWLAHGKAAFLADQARRFDKIAAYHSAPAMLVAGVIFAVLGAGLYELVAAGFARLLPPGSVEE